MVKGSRDQLEIVCNSSGWMALKDFILSWHDAVSQFEQKNYSVAKEMFSSIQDANAKILYNVSCCCFCLKDYKGAGRYLKEAIFKDEHLAIAHFQLGVAHFRRNRFNKALQNFQQAYTKCRSCPFIDYRQLGLEVQLHTCKIVYNVALCLMELDYRDEAKEWINGAFSLDVPQAFMHNLNDAREAIKRKRNYKLDEVTPSLIFCPPRSMVQNAERVDYLGKAKVVSAADRTDLSVGFIPTKPSDVSSPVDSTPAIRAPPSYPPPKPAVKRPSKSPDVSREVSPSSSTNVTPDTCDNQKPFVPKRPTDSNPHAAPSRPPPCLFKQNKPSSENSSNNSDSRHERNQIEQKNVERKIYRTSPTPNKRILQVPYTQNGMNCNQDSLKSNNASNPQNTNSSPFSSSKKQIGIIPCDKPIILSKELNSNEANGAKPISKLVRQAAENSMVKVGQNQVEITKFEQNLSMTSPTPNKKKVTVPYDDRDLSYSHNIARNDDTEQCKKGAATGFSLKESEARTVKSPHSIGKVLDITQEHNTKVHGSEPKENSKDKFNFIKNLVKNSPLFQKMNDPLEVKSVSKNNTVNKSLSSGVSHQSPTVAHNSPVNSRKAAAEASTTGESKVNDMWVKSPKPPRPPPLKKHLLKNKNKGQVENTKEWT